jgi:hypothetical protein
MKIKIFLPVLLLVTLSVGCTRKVVVVKNPTVKSLPPGQAKKMTGSKSAKPYAPGQRKKG